ncbi:MAG: hypothetical protein QXX84_05680 [Sulfolobales archaeon]|nr:hypothetical protein [Sulfolobales archaeon]
MLAVASVRALFGIHYGRASQSSMFDRKVGKLPLPDAEAAVYGDLGGESLIIGNYWSAEPSTSLARVDRGFRVLWRWVGTIRILDLGFN